MKSQVLPKQASDFFGLKKVHDAHLSEMRKTPEEDDLTGKYSMISNKSSDSFDVIDSAEVEPVAKEQPAKEPPVAKVIEDNWEAPLDEESPNRVGSQLKQQVSAKRSSPEKEDDDGEGEIGSDHSD